MRGTFRGALASLLMIGWYSSLGIPSAWAQNPSLGGYGAMAGGSGSSMGANYTILDPSGMGGSVLVPFGGRFGAAMPSGMGGGSGMFFRTRPTPMMTYTRPSFSLSPMGGMSSMGGGMGQGLVRRPFVLPDLGLSGGTGLGGGMRPMPASGGMGVMPPSFAYPFRQPPSLLSPSAGGAGMSM